MRTALHSVLKPGSEAAYDREHATIWPEMVATLQAAGVDDWTIWRSGRHLFHLVECADFARAMSVLASDPVDRRWQEHINRIVDHFEPGVDGLALPLVWTLSRQVADSADALSEADGATS